MRVDGCSSQQTERLVRSIRTRPVIRLPSIESFKLTDEAAGEGEYFGVLTGADLELIGQVGWNAESGKPIEGLPVPIVGEGAKQSLKVRLSWPSPTPHAPLFVWFRGEDAGERRS